jgi:hypothetical protein
MVDLPYFAQHVRRLFDTRPEVARICEEIANYIVEGAGRRKLHLTLSFLRRQTRPNSDADLLIAVQYLTGAEADLLELSYAYVDDGGEQLPIAKEQIAKGAAAAAADLGVEFVDEHQFDSRVVLYFVPTVHVLERVQREEPV